MCKLVVSKEKKARQIDLSRALHINQSEVSTGFERLVRCHLIDHKERTVNRLQAIEFLETAVKFFFPAEFTEHTIGIPTSVFTKPLDETLRTSSSPITLIWPYEGGKVKGLGIIPIHDSAPLAAIEDEKLYQLLAVLDAARTFPPPRVREQVQFHIRKMVFGNNHE